MDDQSRSLWIAVGGIAAIVLGMALTPLRSLTSASNLAFPFLILTIVVAELGGRAAGLMAAVVSALSLNFFLTPPYLTLTIDRADDLVGFVALAVTGLLAAAFGRRRARSSALLGQARHDLDALDRLAVGLAGGGRLDAVLESLRSALSLGALAIRAADGQVVAAAPPGNPVPAPAGGGAGSPDPARRRWTPAPARRAGLPAPGGRGSAGPGWRRRAALAGPVGGSARRPQRRRAPSSDDRRHHAGAGAQGLAGVLAGAGQPGVTGSPPRAAGRRGPGRLRRATWPASQRTERAARAATRGSGSWV